MGISSLDIRFEAVDAHHHRRTQDDAADDFSNDPWLVYQAERVCLHVSLKRALSRIWRCVLQCSSWQKMMTMLAYCVVSVTHVKTCLP